MSREFRVAVTSGSIVAAGNRPVLFHAINKSGSLAMERVLKEAYYREMRAQQLFTHYRGIPRHLSALAEILRHSSGHVHGIAHYAFRAFPTRPETLLVTQVRHPVPRALSVHGWLQGHHEREHGTADGFPDLVTWLRARGGKGHTQIGQLAFGFADGHAASIASTSTSDLAKLAFDHLEHEFAWFGLAEHFEESIFALARICELTAVTAWRTDARNIWRPDLDEVPPETVDAIEEILADELWFYHQAVALFRERIGALRFGPELDEYRAVCASAYRNRVLV